MTGSARKAFTLIDLVVTVLIVGILAAVAAPKFAATLYQARVDSAAERIAADLRYARQSAMSLSASVVVQWDVTSEEYSIPALPDLNQPSQPYHLALNEAPYNASLDSVVLGGDSEIQFDRYGWPDSGGVISISAGGFQQTVSVDGDSGRISIP